MRFILILAFLSFSSVLIAQDRTEIEEQVEKLLFKNPVFQLHLQKGVIVATITGDQINYFSYGTSSPTKNSIFEIGDISKALTGSLVHILVQNGKLSLNSGINQLLPVEFQNPAFNKIQLQDLLSHTSGLARLPHNFGINQIDVNQPFRDYSEEDFKEYIQSLSEDLSSGRYGYSHVNFELIKIILEYKTGMKFNKILDLYFAEPLGLKNTFVDSERPILVQGHNKIGKKVDVLEFSSFQAAKGIKSTCADLALMVSQMMDTNHKLENAFRNSIISTNPTLIDKSTSIASGWHTMQLKRNLDLVVHKGSTSGHSSLIAFVPDTKTAVVVISAIEINIAPVGYQLIEFLNDNWKRKKLLK